MGLLRLITYSHYCHHSHSRTHPNLTWFSRYDVGIDPTTVTMLAGVVTVVGDILLRIWVHALNCLLIYSNILYALLKNNSPNTGLINEHSFSSVCDPQWGNRCTNYPRLARHNEGPWPWRLFCIVGAGINVTLLQMS